MSAEQPITYSNDRLKIMDGKDGEAGLRDHFRRGFTATDKRDREITLIEDTEGTCWFWVFPGCMWAGISKHLINNI